MSFQFFCGTRSFQKKMKLVIFFENACLQKLANNEVLVFESFGFLDFEFLEFEFLDFTFLDFEFLEFELLDFEFLDFNFFFFEFLALWISAFLNFWILHFWFFKFLFFLISDSIFSYRFFTALWAIKSISSVHSQVHTCETIFGRWL